MANVCYEAFSDAHFTEPDTKAVGSKGGKTHYSGWELQSWVHKYNQIATL